jgi:hypothetical protein
VFKFGESLSSWLRRRRRRRRRRRSRKMQSIK